jgi:hypothetical protein
MNASRSPARRRDDRIALLVDRRTAPGGSAGGVLIDVPDTRKIGGTHGVAA